MEEVSKNLKEVLEGFEITPEIQKSLDALKKIEKDPALFVSKTSELVKQVLAASPEYLERLSHQVDHVSEQAAIFNEQNPEVFSKKEDRIVEVMDID